MYSPTTRVLTVLELLQSRHQIGGVELAERLEVDERTVRRYITMLQDMGIPIESRRGRYGMYRLRPGTRLPPLIFRNDEAFALTLGLMTARKMGLTVAAPAVESALAKIERALPVELREHVQAVQDTLIFDFDLDHAAPMSETVIMMCVATQQHRRVLMHYRKWHSEIAEERVFDPYGVVCRSGFWYTVGYCHLRSDIRVFRLDRVVTSTLLDETFPPLQEKFDCLEYVTRSIAMVPTSWAIDVLLETTLEEARRMLPSALAVLEQEEHGVAMRCYVEHLEWIARILAGLHCPFIIRQPIELKETLRQLAEQIAQMATR